MRTKKLSSPLFINLKPSEIPTYNPKVSYFEQEPKTLEFWENEFDKIINGVTIDGWFMHGWLYYHINHFRTPIPDLKNPKAKDIIMAPPLDDNMMYVIENYMEAEKEQKGLCLFGTRGFTKSTFLASLSSYTSLIKPFGHTQIVGGDSGDLNAITGLIRTNFENAPLPFKLPINKKDWAKFVDFGMQEKSNEEHIHSSVVIKNVNGGKDSQSEKGAGGTPYGFIVDEIGKFDPRGVLRSALPAFRVGSGFRLVPLLSGTGGNNELSEGALSVLENPDAFSMLPMNWDILNRNVPEKYRTWSNTQTKKFCTFVPGHMSYRIEVPKLKSNLAEYLGGKFKKSKELVKIVVMVTDWEKADAWIENEINSQEKEDDRNKVKMYYPRTVEDCFLTENINPFPVEKCLRKMKEIEANPKYRAMDLIRSFDESGIVGKLEENYTIAGRRFEGKPIDAPFLIYGDLPEGIAPKNLFVSGLDDYKLDQASSSESLGSFYVLKRRNTELNMPCETIALSLTTRPRIHNRFYDKLEISITKYSALCTMESIDTGFVSYLNKGLQPYDYLTVAFSPGQDLIAKKKKQLNSLFGIYPTVANKAYLINLAINYANATHPMGIDPHTNLQLLKSGVDFIEDPMLLKEMIDYTPTANCDRIVAFAHAIAYARKLDAMNILPEDLKKDIDEDNRRFIRNNHEQKKKVISFTNHTTVRFKNHRS